ncbi:hypothetical protein CXF83_21825 [Shewanella sp. Choline-02u-19]|uniref:hypothetical protein n=1 Tax=unclassified Shewanella TaxID=196818 RepID=UPI000C330E6F|nr:MULTISPECIES: hypothetical protein [unclassified Shewanella]PKH59332.1 hypothetical protein CXF84_03535 [Shewanella sp. Bg11-22]PKI29157.1 hypothetical protein CXF83_21825 [Shewanella sp. Choline-02u-19]
MNTFAEHSTEIDNDIADSEFLTKAVAEAKQELKRWYLEREQEGDRLTFESSIMVAKAREYNSKRTNQLAFEIADLQTGFDADKVAQIAAFNAVDTLKQLADEFEDGIIDEMMNIVNSIYSGKLLVVLFRDEGSIESNMGLVRDLREAKLTGDIDLIVSVLAKAEALRAVK